MEIYIETDGSRLKVKNNIFLIETKVKKTEVSPVNVKSFVIGGKISITSCAIELAIKNDIEIVFVDRYNKPFCRMMTSQFSKSGYLRQMQYKVFNSPMAFEIAKITLLKKGSKQELYAKELVEREEGSNNDLIILNNLIEQLKYSDSGSIEELMGIEGMLSKKFYQILSKNLRGQFTFKSRSFRPARDEFNASLNYIYGILYRKVERALLNAGLDINTGYLHSNKTKSLSLVYDFIEFFRNYGIEFNYWIYRRKLVKKSYFEYSKNGVTMSKSGKDFILNQFNLYLNRSERYKEKDVKREEIIKLEAYSFGDLILKLSEEMSQNEQNKL